ncbi:hypothetical protein KKC59_04950 [bacterium]|nr:hypothetical protein [bacterium]MBU1613602.1 hypothetical protein [Patescibacteria group bacterium]
MRKIELIELVQDFLAGGDAPAEIKGRYHPEIIANHLALAYNRIVFETYMEAKQYSDYSTLDGWAKNHTLSIVSNAVALPYPPVQLPNNMGILQVAVSTDLNNTFAYRETNANSVFNILEVGSVSTKPTFYLEVNAGSGNNSHALQLGLVPDGCTQVKVKMIVPLDAVDDFDTVSIPAGKEDMILQYVIELMSKKLPEDKVHDNNANQR